ncbi:MAG: hypothetical protein A3H02_02580 [Candidatus Niyogibacteria bacterium RIFCSPLOWO2_12_FULL_41_13]|uniref:Glycosyltransferase 2-like domain-containing protein n=1 Tax=Candidatus Niyogibacteria bacterium RIFCSPLOWO2_12_FULL_41_13 TaxID=1801726 RepID=A0A1G2F1Q5_9BACT|nr:MAG: hypothetical protein A3H02_02580 [Candidatus Niyogibacteria bacterium RIFCSPLOWO2_12_FULL_41_13]
MAKGKKLISVIIPVYNEEKNILLIYNEIKKVWENLAENYDYELIFVNDCSQDKSGEEIEKIAEGDKQVKHLEFSRNFGKEIATSAGLHHALGEAAIMIDADLQHPSEFIPEFVEKWENGAPVVVGIREKNKGEELFKRIGSALFYRIMNLIGETQIIPNATDFRLLDRKVIEEFKKFTERNRITRALVDWLGFEIARVYFRANERKSGKAGYNYLKLIKLALSSFVSHSLFPLKLAGYLGIFITVFSTFLGLFVIIEQIILKDPLGVRFSGTAMLAVMILFLVGVMLSSLGLIALYIAHIHDEVINRPMYVIKNQKSKIKNQNYD